ncbi:hypothetical protein HYH03_017979 [Edaphochlamys debaryana]|uniref:Uncharacterized protein n=1 Tax=Edaphochlamys debaryana TaxID=47281 RepID=A0A836BQ05_9CHLO|nr:hypothetical protein HYH03_017979 [Edaphochlamys debaryana]|eukprot:KAG2483133.1 hypothetical protein HYH03_017979 [Edaphochlamys debaryana]
MCLSSHHFETATRNELYARALKAWVRQESRQEERVLRAAAARRALYGAVCPLLQRLWGALHPDITAQADAFVGALPQEPWVALHVRGGDKVAEYASVPARRNSNHSLLEGMRALAVRHPAARGRACVIMGDDPVLGQERFNSAAFEHRCNSTRALLTDFSIMARAPYLVANMASNVASVAFWVRGCVLHQDLDTLFDGHGLEDWITWF